MKHISPNQLWTQVPVANRLVEVNTKTGFTLTAGSYSIRESSVQRGVATSAVGTFNVTISAVTMANAAETCHGPSCSTNDVNQNMTRGTLTTTTNMAFYKAGGVGTPQTSFVVSEFF